MLLEISFHVVTCIPHAQILENVDAVWTAAVAADPNLLVRLAKIRADNLAASRARASARKHVMLPPHKVKHNVRVLHNPGDGSKPVYLKVLVSDEITAKNLRAALKKSPYTSVREYSKRKISKCTFELAGVYKKYLLVEAVPKRTFTATFKVDDVVQYETYHPMNVLCGIEKSCRRFLSKKSRVVERSARVELVIDGIRALDIPKRSFMKMVPGADGKTTKHVCLHERKRFVDYVEKKMRICAIKRPLQSSYTVTWTTTKVGKKRKAGAKAKQTKSEPSVEQEAGKKRKAGAEGSKQAAKKRKAGEKKIEGGAEAGK